MYHGTLGLQIIVFSLRGACREMIFDIALLNDIALLQINLNCHCFSLCYTAGKQIFEPQREKTGLRGFRPDLTQTGLYTLRKRLEA